jgi:ATP-dependent DNA ligase
MPQIGRTVTRSLLKMPPGSKAPQSSTLRSCAQEDIDGDGDAMFEAVCQLGLEGIVSKRLYVPYRSGPSKNWIKTKNPKAPAAIRVIEGGF